jgi:hypothetical protein
MASQSDARQITRVGRRYVPEVTIEKLVPKQDKTEGIRPRMTDAELKRELPWVLRPVYDVPDVSEAKLSEYKHEVPITHPWDKSSLKTHLSEILRGEVPVDFDLERSKKAEVSDSKTRWDWALDRISEAIAFATSFDAGVFKAADNAWKDRDSLFSRFARGVCKVIKWHVIPGSFVIDMALLVVKGARPTGEIKETQPFKTESFRDFRDAQILGFVNRLDLG